MKKKKRSCDKYNMERSEHININFEEWSKRKCSLYNILIAQDKGEQNTK